ncbi:hypothetical protein GCM10023183_15430 [Nibribacter koreensis]|uniref:DUF3592 domain-containing protein n=2 Tax=Nibribacter koreensis TaxID=1084519 RepID=A0ABP8FG69_9BACT
MTVFFSAVTIWGVNNYLYKEKAFEDSAETTGIVTYLQNSKGVRVSLYSYIRYDYQVDGQKFEGSQKSEEGLNPIIGDCIKITYSITDPIVSKINFSAGVVKCE